MRGTDMIFYALALVVLVAIALVFMSDRGQSDDVKDLARKATDALAHAVALDGSLRDIETRMKNLEYAIIERNESVATELLEIKEVQKRVAVLELPRAGVFTHVVLRQEKPLRVDVRYKKYAESEEVKRPPPIPDAQIKAAIKSKLKKELAK